MRKSGSRNLTTVRPSPGMRNHSPHAEHPRDNIQDFDDPYRPDRHLPAETVCSRCGAVYVNQHWTFDEERKRMLLGAGQAHEVICPGCKKIADRNPQGVVTLHGDYWPGHRDEILNLIRNEEARGMNANPLERVMEIREENGRLIIETTNEKLAQRIGRQMAHAHNGKVQYKWSEDNQLVRVEWERSLNHR